MVSDFLAKMRNAVDTVQEKGKEDAADLEVDVEDE